MPETATIWNEIERWEIRKAGLSVDAKECRFEKSCASCGGPIPFGQYYLRVRGRYIHDHCAEDLGVEVR